MGSFCCLTVKELVVVFKNKNAVCKTEDIPEIQLGIDILKKPYMTCCFWLFIKAGIARLRDMAAS